MTRRFKWISIILLIVVWSCLGALGGVSFYWLRQQPDLEIVPAALVKFKSGSESYIPVPALSDLPTPLGVRSIIQSEDKSYQLTSPLIRINDITHLTYEVIVPGDLQDGIYTVSLVVGYNLNPLRYTEQSFAIALLYIDGGSHALFDNDSSATTVRPASATAASAASD